MFDLSKKYFYTEHCLFFIVTFAIHYFKQWVYQKEKKEKN
jgi:hypothetical protein